MSRSNKSPEIHKRRGTFVQPLAIEKQTDTNSRPTKAAIRKSPLPGDVDNNHVEWPWPFPPKQETISTTTSEVPENETYEEALDRNKAFFKNAGLARVCDTVEDKRQADLFYQRLLEDVTDRSVHSPGYRGLAQIVSFWEDVRQQLAVRDDEIEVEAFGWPEGYPGEQLVEDEKEQPCRRLRRITADLPRWSVFRIAETRDEIGDIIDLYTQKTSTPNTPTLNQSQDRVDVGVDVVERRVAREGRATAWLNRMSGMFRPST